MRCADGSWSYFIRRFDRAGHNGKLPVEDFAQLAGLSRETKYDFSMERLVNVLDTPLLTHPVHAETAETAETACVLSGIH